MNDLASVFNTISTRETPHPCPTLKALHQTKIIKYLLYYLWLSAFSLLKEYKEYKDEKLYHVSSKKEFCDLERNTIKEDNFYSKVKTAMNVAKRWEVTFQNKLIFSGSVPTGGTILFYKMWENILYSDIYLFRFILNLTFFWPKT